jgi:cobalt-zinc-cadmium efflux system outer membrane protein
MHPIPAAPHLLRIACLGLWVVAGVVRAAACGDLAAATAAATERDPQRLAVAGQRARADGVADDAGHWLSGPASLRASWLSDAPVDSVGLREYEGGLALALRLPGERVALGVEAAATARLADAAEHARRLAVAGRVRAAFWALAGARVERARAAHEHEHLAELDALVAERVARGDAAALDRGAEASARESWMRLTGCADVPAPALADPVVRVPEPGGHPRRRLADAAVDRARAARDAARARPAAAPVLGLTVRRERGEAAAPWIDSVGVGLTVPLGRSGTRARERGEAERTLALAEAERAALRRDLAGEAAAARSRLEAARLALAATERREAHAEAAVERARRAWRDGAWDTAALLRTEGLAAEARLAAERARIDRARAAARLEQTLGVLP